jgi:hypothetical protein
METKENAITNEATNALFSSSAQWMRAYAIIMIIFASILTLAVLVLSAGGKGMIIDALSKQQETKEVANVFVEIYGMMVFALATFVILMGYASIKLLGAANKFTAISYTSSSANIIAAFKNLRMYWMFYGITLLVAVVFVIYFVFKAFSIISQLEAN